MLASVTAVHHAQPSASGIGDRGLVRAPIRGRTDELTRIGAVMAALVQGRGGVLIIEGAPGIGKSRLLAEVVALAERAGVRTLLGEAFEHQQSVPFFSLFMATFRADPPVGDVESLRGLGNSADLGYWVVSDLQRAIVAAAAQTPLAIVLEDVHWADTGTLLALRSLAMARPDVPVLWVLTARAGAGGHAVEDTLSVLRRANATLVRVPAMSRADVVDMVQDAVRANADESLLNLTEKAHGNPFLVRELIAGLHEEGRLTVGGGWALVTGDNLPRRMTSCVQRRLDLLSSGAAEAVRVASVLPDRFSAGLLAAMLDRRPSALMWALDEAVRAGLLVDDGDQLRFQDEVVREATQQSLGVSLRRAIQRQSASIMLAMGVAPAEVAHQLACSAQPGDRQAITALRQAAVAVSRSDAAAAADLSERALELTRVDDVEYGRVVAETVGLLNRARRYARAEELAVAALSRASDKGEAEIRLQLPAFTKHGSQRRAEENRRALELTDIGDVTRARHLALLAYNLMLDDEGGSQRAAADEAAAAAECVGDIEAKVIANLTLACFDGSDGNVCRALDNIGQLCTLARTSDLPLAHRLAAIYHVNSLTLVGRLDEAAEQVTAGVECARHERDAMAMDVWAIFDGMVHLAAGRLATARAAVESLPLPEESGATELDAMRMTVLVQSAVSTGDRNLLQQIISEAHDAYATGSSMVRRAAAYVLALAAWHRGDLDEAMHWFGADVDLLGTPLTPDTLDRVVLAARIAAAAGDAACRSRLVGVIEKLERAGDAIPLFASIVKYVRGILDGDARALVAAADLLRASPRPLLHAAATEDAGRQLLQAGRHDEALRQFNTAFDAYTHLGAQSDARRVGRELRRLGAERRIVSHARAKTGWDSLTDSELKVVNIIVQGASNRAVADQLHLSLHTVKTHVHNAFGKLGISSRNELAQRRFASTV